MGSLAAADTITSINNSFNEGFNGCYESHIEMVVSRQETFSTTKSSMSIGSPAEERKSDAARQSNVFTTFTNIHDLKKQIQQAHIDTLSRIAQFTTHVQKDQRHDTIKSTNEEILAHAATTQFWGDIFSLQHSGELTREVLDQKLVNWCLQVPGLRENFDALPENVRAYVEEFRTADLSSKGNAPKMEGFRMPGSPATVKKSSRLKAALEEQFRIDRHGKYKNVVENDGTAVQYVDKTVFENWGETVKNTPAVSFS